MAKVALIVGVVGIVLGGGVFLVSVLLPPLTNGRTSWEEAMFGIIPGALILMVSFVVAIVGVVLLITKKKKTPA